MAGARVLLSCFYGAEGEEGPDCGAEAAIHGAGHSRGQDGAAGLNESVNTFDPRLRNEPMSDAEHERRWLAKCLGLV
jgi:hypothetical protein